MKPHKSRILVYERQYRYLTTSPFTEILEKLHSCMYSSSNSIQHAFQSILGMGFVGLCHVLSFSVCFWFANVASALLKTCQWSYFYSGFCSCGGALCHNRRMDKKRVPFSRTRERQFWILEEGDTIVWYVHRKSCCLVIILLLTFCVLLCIFEHFIILFFIDIGKA